MTARPKTLSREERLIAFQDVAKQAADWAGDGDVEGWAETIEEEADFFLDGYALARRLEDRGVDVDMSLAEILDGARGVLGFALRAKQKAWASEQNICPPYPIGTRVVVADWRRGEQLGTIDEVYEHGPAQYCVKLDCDANERGTPRRIINFEDARLASLPSEGGE